MAQFHYHGGTLKNRQWALDSLSFENDWVLLLDADEVLTTDLCNEMGEIIRDRNLSGSSTELSSGAAGRLTTKTPSPPDRDREKVHVTQANSPYRKFIVFRQITDFAKFVRTCTLNRS